MTPEAIAAAQAEVRSEAGTLQRKPEVEAKAERLRVTVEDIRKEWERKAAEGDQRAARLLRECYPEDFEQVDRAAEVLAHWQEGERDGD